MVEVAFTYLDQLLVDLVADLVGLVEVDHLDTTLDNQFILFMVIQG